MTTYSSTEERLNGLALEEDRLAVELKEDDLIAKLPARMRKVIRKPNWSDNYHEMCDPSPACSTLCGSEGFCLACNTVVNEGDLLLAWYHDGKPKVFGPGMHNFTCCCWSNPSQISAAADYIKHGPLYIITVDQGMLGYGVEKGVPVILAPGRHKISSWEFVWRGYLDLSKTIVEIGEWTLVRVDFGRVGVATLAGKMSILKQGLHLFEPPEIFLRFVNTRIQILQLPECVQESSDYVPLLIKANVSYQVKDPLMCINKIQNQQAERVITEVSSAAIAAIIRSSTLGDMAIASKAGDDGEGETFSEKMHTKFMSQVGQQLLDTMGIEVTNINIEKLQIKDPVLAGQISAQAVQISELEAQHKTLQKEGEVRRQKAQIEKDVAQERADAEYIVTAKRAEASKLKALHEAEAESEAIRLKCDAEIEAFIQRSRAEAEHAERMGSSDLHRELALIKARLDPQVKALDGITKVAYVPHLRDIVERPGGLFTPLKDIVPAT